MTDFKIKIDLENQSVVQETPKKGSKKRRRDPNKTDNAAGPQLNPSFS